MDGNLYEVIRGRRHYLQSHLVCSFLFQLLLALDHMHRKGIFHRDIKPENILVEKQAEEQHRLKLADFGSCRGIYSKQPYTEYISTRWYRAPECLLTGGYYGPEMDIWGAGCVFFEITSLYPLFPGTNELDQIHRIHKVLGTPSRQVQQKLTRHGGEHASFDFPRESGDGISRLIKHAAAACLDLMLKMLWYDAGERVHAREALQHPYFLECRSSAMHIGLTRKMRHESKLNDSGTRIRVATLATQRTKGLPALRKKSSDRHYFKTKKRATPPLITRRPRNVRHARIREQGPSVSDNSRLATRCLPPIAGVSIQSFPPGHASILD